MAGISISPLVLAAGLLPLLALAVAAAIGALRAEPPSRSVDPIWVVLAIETAVVGAVMTIISAVDGNLPLVELALAGAIGGFGVAMWLDRAARDTGSDGDDGWGRGHEDEPNGPDGDPNAWTDRDERAFRDYVREGSRVPALPVLSRRETQHTH